MNKTLQESLLRYFVERNKLSKIDGWVGKSTASNLLTPIYLTLRALKLVFQNILKENSIEWLVQMSMGQGAATPDHYIAFLPPEQKVSNGIYVCLCFDRTGTGFVLGAMTSLKTKQRIDIQPIVRGNFMPSASKEIQWQMLPSNQVNVWGRNNGFFNPLEISIESFKSEPEKTCDRIINHILESGHLAVQLISQKKRMI